MLDAEGTSKALDDFFRDNDDAEWQRLMDRFGWLLQRLLPA